MPLVGASSMCLFQFYSPARQAKTNKTNLSAVPGGQHHDTLLIARNLLTTGCVLLAWSWLVSNLFGASFDALSVDTAHGLGMP